jgi:hypothetical protein
VNDKMLSSTSIGQFGQLVYKYVDGTGGHQMPLIFLISIVIDVFCKSSFVPSSKHVS